MDAAVADGFVPKGRGGVVAERVDNWIRPEGSKFWLPVKTSVKILHLERANPLPAPAPAAPPVAPVAPVAPAAPVAPVARGGRGRGREAAVAAPAAAARRRWT